MSPFNSLFCKALYVWTVVFSSISAKDPHSVAVVPQALRDQVANASTTKTASETVPQAIQEPFIPETYWKPIKDGQAIPAGLHVRMDLTTGVKEAKRMDPADQPQKTQTHVGSVDESAYLGLGAEQNQEPERQPILRQELEEALKRIDKGEDLFENDENFQDERTRVGKKFRSMKELKEEFAEMNLQIKTDREILKDLISQYNNSKKLDSAADVAVLLSFLQDIEYYVHQIDNARDFFDMGGILLVKESLNSSFPEVTSEAAHIIGSAAQSNAKVQVYLLEQHILPSLLQILRAEITSEIPGPLSELVLSRCLYAISAIIRHFPLAQKEFVQVQGLESLSGLLKRAELPRKLHRKAITLVNDLLTERKDAREANPAENSLISERLRQYALVPLELILHDEAWCELTIGYLDDADHDTAEKIMTGMRLLMSQCHNVFLPGMSQLRSLLPLYQQLARSHNEMQKDDFFSATAHLCEDLIVSLQTTGRVIKQEL